MLINGCLPPETPLLHGGEVHVWTLHLPEAKSGLDQFYGTLSADEIERAESFVFERDRIVFVLTRGVLRCLLANYLNETPASIRFAFNEFGKPELHERSHPRLRFNVSHSAEYSLLAVSRDMEVGVDIEWIDSRVDVGLASDILSDKDYDQFRALPDQLKRDAFYRAWTRKEALIKGVGRGLSIPLKSFDVAFTPHDSAQLQSVRLACDSNEWSLYPLEVNGDYAAALAVSSPLGQVRSFVWKHSKA